jgi:hypothetical protein
MDLARTERLFQDGLLGRSHEIMPHVRGNARESADTMFGVYRNAYWARLVECLSNDFPGLKALVGEAAFDTLARAYVAKHPSQHPSVRWAGHALAEFVSAEAPYRDDPWIADMARFDWALAHAFDAADAPAAGLVDLATVPPEFWGSIRLALHPSVDFFRVTTPVDETQPALVSDSSVAVDRTARCARGVLVWRIEHDVKFRAADPQEIASLEAMQRGATFGDMCEQLARELDEEAATVRAAQTLQGWLQWGVVARVEHDGLGSAA